MCVRMTGFLGETASSCWRLGNLFSAQRVWSQPPPVIHSPALWRAAADLLAVPLTGVPSAEGTPVNGTARRSAAARHKAGEWITGGGWDHTLWAEKRFPNRQQLDAVSPKNPVILTHISGHVAVANSLALKSAEIDKNTPNPPGGEIEHDAFGEPTGMLKEYGDVSRHGEDSRSARRAAPQRNRVGARESGQEWRHLRPGFFRLGGLQGLQAAQGRRKAHRSNHRMASVQFAAQRSAEYARTGRHHGPLREDRRAESLHRWRDGFAHRRHAGAVLRRSLHERNPDERSR